MPFSDQEENTLTSPTPTLPSAKGRSLQLPEIYHVTLQPHIFQCLFPGKQQLTEHTASTSLGLSSSHPHFCLHFTDRKPNSDCILGS